MPKFQFRHTPTQVTLSLVLAIVFPSLGFSADGTWNVTTTPGLWSNSANWLGGTIANGSGFTADFNTLDPSADIQLRLDSARTLTNLTFGDTNTATAGGWLLDNNGSAANILTLAGTTPTITVNALGAGKVATISAVIAGSAGLTKAGLGTLTLSATNTYTTGTIVSAGTLRAGGATNPFGATNSAITVQSGATLDVNGQSLNAENYNLTISGAGVGGFAVTNSGARQDGALRSLTLAGDATIGSDAGSGSGGAGRFGFRTTGGVALTVTGAGFDLTKSGANYVSIDGLGAAANVTGVKNINVNAGTFTVAYNTTVDNSVAGFINVNTGGTFAVASQNDATGVSILKPISMNGGILATDTTRSAGNATIAAGITLNSGAANNINPLAASVLKLNGGISGTAGNSLVFAGQAGSAVALSGASTYLGTTTVSSGALSLLNTSAKPSNTITVANGAALGLAVNGVNSFSSADIDSLFTGTLSGVSMGATAQVGIDTNGGNFTYGTLQGAGVTRGLNKLGAGTLTIENANAYTGVTTVTEGILLLKNAFAVQNSTVTTQAQGTIIFSSAVAGNAFTFGALAAGAAGNALGAFNGTGYDIKLENDAAAAIALTVGGNNANTTFQGILSGSGSLIKAGTGTMTMAPGASAVVHTYTGDTTIRQGGINVSFERSGVLNNVISTSSDLQFGDGKAGNGAWTNPTLTVTSKAATTNSQTFASTTLADGVNAQVTGVNTGTALTIDLGTIARTTTNNILNLTNPAGVTIKATNANNASGILGNWATFGASGTQGTDWAANNGSGTLVAYTGYTTVTGATPTIASSATSNVNLTGVSATVTLAAAGTTDVNTIKYSDAIARTLEIGVNKTLRLGASGAIFRSDTTAATLLTIGSATSVANDKLTAGGADDTAGQINFIGNNNQTNGTGGSIRVNSDIVDNGTGAVSVLVSGQGELGLFGANVYSGGTVITGRGRVSTSNNGAAFGTGSVAVHAGAQVFFGDGAVTWANDFTIAGNGTSENTAFGALRLANGTIIGNGSSVLTLAENARIGASRAGGNSATIASQITGNFNLEITSGRTNAASASIFTLTDTANNWGGDLGINGVAAAVKDDTTAIVRLGASEVLPNGVGKGNVILTGGIGTLLIDTAVAGGNVQINAGLNLNGFNETINGLSSGSTATANQVRSAVFNGGSADATLTVGDNNATASFGGLLLDGATNKLGIAKTGTGTQILSGANSYTGPTTVNGGILQAGVASVANVSGAFGKNSAVTLANTSGVTLALNNFDTQIGSLTGGGNSGGNVTLGSATLTLGADNSSPAAFAGVISGTGNVVKTGTGAQIFTGTNTYSGTTTVSAGKLQIGSSGAGTSGTGAVTVQTGSTILGTGVVKGASFTAESGSSVHAGDTTAQSSYGTLTFTPASGSGSFNFQSGSSTILGINPGGSGDLLNFDGLSNGSLLFNGNLAVTASGYIPSAVDIFNLLDWANLSTTTFHSRYSSGSYGGFLLGNGDDSLGFDLPDISGSGYGWDISQFTTNGTIRTVSIVPEPSRALLLCFGCVGLGLRRRRSSTQA
ncbi:MAG: autotransporter-associated beta strand repeat-containing protein [Prosthecobacter sp.]